MIILNNDTPENPNKKTRVCLWSLSWTRRERRAWIPLWAQVYCVYTE